MDDFHATRSRIHTKANRYLVFQWGRWDRDRWRQFYGATDALLDAGEALSGLKNGLPAEVGAAKLACYGFLQALYIQQDAVRALWNCLDLPGNALTDPGVLLIREWRDRIAGHPVRADRGKQKKRPSSAILSLHIARSAHQFQSAIYYDDGHELIDINITDFTSKNEMGLILSLRKIERAMDEKEAEFRATESAQPLSAKFEQGIGYALEKLRSPIGDGRREMALRLIGDQCDSLEALLEERGFSTDGARYHLSVVRAGIRLGSKYSATISPAADQLEWDVIGDGIASNINDIRAILKHLDQELSEPVVVSQF